MLNKLELHGRKWFERTNGNTYFSAVAVYNGENIAEIAFQYGYGDHWLYELTKLVSIKKPDSYSLIERGNDQPWQFIDRLESEGIAVFTNCQQVTRKKDLKFF